MNDEELGHKIASRLDESLNGLPPRVARRLALARAQAIARHADVTAGAADRTGSAAVQALSRIGSPRIMAPVFGLVVALVIMFYWQESRRVEMNYADNADLDAQMLTDELPVTAYLDQGFEIWLYHETSADARQ
ncbi:MAG: DUF3619 family protein [Burkholderiales bacterium]|nr:DUF3619 family protein [Burkholderiales bacterium]MCL4728681.1 DUF3619 family protein [Candidatus Kuenenia stuttgartiensis]